MFSPGLVSAIDHRIEQHRNRFSRLLRHAVQVLHESRRCHTPRRLLGATLLSVLAWELEALGFYWILQAMGADIGLLSATFIYAVAMLAGALSFMPGGLGSAETVMVALLVSGAIEVPDAIAATVSLRLVTLWLAVAFGTVLRIYDLLGRSLWYDEVFSVGVSDPENSLSEVFYQTVQDVHPPFYQILLWLVFRVFGYGEWPGRVFRLFWAWQCFQRCIAWEESSSISRQA